MSHLFRRRSQAALHALPHGLPLLGLLLSGLLPVAAPAAYGQVAPITQHNDNLRTGANLGEKILTTSNVNTTTFGKLYGVTVDGTVFAQPLYVPNVSIGGGTHNVLYVATAHDSVYAFDADTGALLIGPVSLGTPVPSSAMFPEDGIIGTPVIDPSTGTLYVAAKTYAAATGVQNFFLHALSCSTLQDKVPVVLITGQVSGTGYGANNPLDNNGQTVFFYPNLQVQRPALTLVGAGSRPVVYVAFGSLDDINPYHGWVMGYDGATLAQTSVFNDTPNGGEGGIWMSSQGLVADPGGNLYALTGNSSQSTENKSADYGESFLKLTPSGSALSVTDYFKCFNYDSLNASDGDLGSGGLVGIPGTNSIVGGGKQGTFYLVNTNNMGKLSTTGTDNVLQEWQANNGLLGSPVFWNSNTPTLYVWSGNDQLRAYPFSYTTGRFNTTPSSVSAFYTPPGSGAGVLAVSSNGTTAGTGIVWATVPAADPERAATAGTLYAYDATNLATQLWNSSQNPARDAYGNYTKFCAPTVAGGKVFVATNSGQVCVYGLLTLQAPTNLAAATGSNSAALTWTAPGNPSTALSYNVYRGTGPRLEAAVPVAKGVTGTTYTDTGLTSGTKYYYKVTAITSGGEGAQSNEAIAVPNTTGTVDYQVDAGYWTSVPPFAADAYYSAPSSTASTTNAITVTGVPNAAPAAVYQSVRFAPSGNLDYTFKGLTPRAAYTVRLHEAENWVSPDGPRLFNLTINGTQVLTNFNIFAAAGGAGIALVRNFNTVADTNGNIFIQGSHGSASDPMFGGFEVLNGSVTAPPSSLGAVSGSGRVALTWSAVPGATGYNLYRSTAPGGEGSIPIAAGLTTAAYTDASLTPGTAYYYLVTAVNANGESARSGEAGVAPSSQPPAAPSGLAAVGGNSQVALTWSAVPVATSYTLSQGTAPGKEAPYKTGLTGTSYTDTGLTNSTLYYYTIAAVNADGTSGPSQEASATPKSPLPVAPTGLSVTRSLNNVTLRWNAVSGATTYNLYRGNSSGGETLYASALTSAAFSQNVFFSPAYYYQSTAVNSSGESARSSEIHG